MGNEYHPEHSPVCSEFYPHCSKTLVEYSAVGNIAVFERPRLGMTRPLVQSGERLILSREAHAAGAELGPWQDKACDGLDASYDDRPGPHIFCVSALNLPGVVFGHVGVSPFESEICSSMVVNTCLFDLLYPFAGMPLIHYKAFMIQQIRIPGEEFVNIGTSDADVDPCLAKFVMFALNIYFDETDDRCRNDLQYIDEMHNILLKLPYSSTTFEQPSYDEK